MANSVYIETSIPSAYATTRDDLRSLIQREDTRRWWQQQREYYDCFSSQEVLDELLTGGFQGRADAMNLIADLPLLEINDDVRGIAGIYVREKLMPGPPTEGDSLHVAIASCHQVDFLLTWNIRHLANPNKVEHLTVINQRLGLLTPVIVTPEMLWMEEEDV